MTAPVPICADTKIGSMLDANPALEEVLISLAPAFANLRNPRLRRTVAKIATVAQAARIGGLPVNELVRRLRDAAGQTAGDAHADEEIASGEIEPDWVSGRIAHDLDGDQILETGSHPLATVRSCAQSLDPGEVVRLMTSFRPEPLIEVMRQAGIAAYCVETSPGRHTTWFSRL
jgi:hypothetical protein